MHFVCAINSLHLFWIEDLLTHLNVGTLLSILFIVILEYFFGNIYNYLFHIIWRIYKFYLVWVSYSKGSNHRLRNFLHIVLWSRILSYVRKRHFPRWSRIVRSEILFHRLRFKLRKKLKIFHIPELFEQRPSR